MNGTLLLTKKATVRRADRRSIPSRVYRAALSKRTFAHVVVIGLCAWGVVAVTAMPLRPAEADAAALYWNFFAAALAAVIGIVTLVGASFALGARYVAAPAAAKAVKDHVAEGVAAHLSFVSRVEYEHLIERLGTIDGNVKVLLERTGGDR